MVVVVNMSPDADVGALSKRAMVSVVCLEVEEEVDPGRRRGPLIGIIKSKSVGCALALCLSLLGSGMYCAGRCPG